MKLAEKLKLLRGLEGNLRGLKRPLTKSEVSRLVSSEQDDKISVAYLSQLETGKRPHMTETTRELLSRFYKVHPGFFVNDPDGFDSTAFSVSLSENRFDSWLMSGARQLSSSDPEVADALRCLAKHEASRAMVLLMSEMVRNPGLLSCLRNAFPSTDELTDELAAKDNDDQNDCHP